jgi:hypothetical protein
MTKIKQDPILLKVSGELSNNYANVVIVKGEVKGEGAYNKIIDIGKEYGLVLLADELTTLY